MDSFNLGTSWDVLRRRYADWRVLVPPVDDYSQCHTARGKPLRIAAAACKVFWS
jgi:hypothetical protein